METYLQEYQNQLYKEKTNQNTAQSYISDVSHFIRYLREKNITAPQEISETILKTYVSETLKQGYSSATVARRVSAVRGFLRYLFTIGETAADQSLYIHPPKYQKKLPEILSAEEVECLLASPHGQDPKAVRDKAMIELMYASGIGVSELIALNVRDTNLEVGYIHCKTQNDVRLIPIGKMCRIALENYILDARQSLAAEGTAALFVNVRGTRMTRQGVWKLLKQYAKISGIEREITPRLLRHSFAAHLVDNGADIVSVQTMLGHTNAASTKVYEKLQDKKLRDIYKKSHPRA